MVIIPRGKTARLIVKSMTLMREENEPWNTDLFYACRKSFIFVHNERVTSKKEGLLY